MHRGSGANSPKAKVVLTAAVAIVVASAGWLTAAPAADARVIADSPSRRPVARTAVARRARLKPVRKVPRVVGLAGSIGTTRLRAAGYRVWVGRPRYDAKVPRGRVVSQVASAGTALRQGRTVTTYESLGPAPRYTWKNARASTYGGHSENQSVAGPYPSTGKLESRGTLYFAHKMMPFGTKVVFRYGGRTAAAICVDRGPYVGGRQFDLGSNTAHALGFGGVGSLDYAIVR